MSTVLTSELDLILKQGREARKLVMTGHLQEAETIVARLGNDLLNLRHAIYQEANRAQ